MKTQETKKRPIGRIAAVAAILAAAAAVLLLLHGWETRRQENSTTEDPYAGQEEALTYYNGAWYARKELETVLVMGVDKYATDTAEPDSYVNQEQADFLLLLVLDRKAGVCTALPLNRDTMTEITALGLAGERTGTFTGQLALAHTYGSGGLDSARNEGRAVSTLLYGTDIDHVMAFTMDAVPVLTDAVGGVTVLVEDDFSAMTDQLPMGQEVTLRGELALTFVRGRGGMGGEKTNLNRMARQSVYLQGLYSQLQGAAQNEGFLTQLLLELSPYLDTDCTATQLNDLYQTVVDDRLEVLDAPAGEAVAGDEFMEFHVDEDALRQTVIDLFYEQRDPA